MFLIKTTVRLVIVQFKFEILNFFSSENIDQTHIVAA